MHDDKNLLELASYIADVIFQQNLVTKHIANTEDFSRLSERIKWSNTILKKKLDIYDSEDKQEKYQKFMKKITDLEPRDLLHDTTMVALYTASSLFEAFKQYLVNFIDNKKLGITPTSTYGEIIFRLSKKML